MISHSATRKLSPRNSSTPYDELKPRLRPKRGRLVKYSAGRDDNKLLEGDAKRPGVNINAWPRDSSHDQVVRLHFNAS
jgi:hypothetical protein